VRVAGVPQRLFDVICESGLDRCEPRGGDGGDILFAHRLLLEEAREEQVHEIGGEPVNRVLGRQVDTVEVVDAAFGFVGGE